MYVSLWNELTQPRTFTPNPNKMYKPLRETSQQHNFRIYPCLSPHDTSFTESSARCQRVCNVVCVQGTSVAPLSVHCLATLLRFSTSRPFRASRAPSLANRTLVPAPMPELAPVIRATFPLREDTWNRHLNTKAIRSPIASSSMNLLQCHSLWTRQAQTFKVTRKGC